MYTYGQFVACIRSELITKSLCSVAIIRVATKSLAIGAINHVPAKCCHKNGLISCSN